jgi:hypothetical protein
MPKKSHATQVWLQNISKINLKKRQRLNQGRQGMAFMLGNTSVDGNFHWSSHFGHPSTHVPYPRHSWRVYVLPK